MLRNFGEVFSYPRYEGIYGE